jgi:phosphate transport system substrate-binding protein
VAYRYVTTQLVWTYTTYLNATEGVQRYDQGQVDFIAIDAPEPSLPPSQVALPLMAGALALTYNLPGLPTTTSNGTNASLVLDRHVLARIWLGQVTQWNDPYLVRLNPILGPYLPNATIALAWLPGLGVTRVFARALASFMDDLDPITAAGLRANGTLQYLPPVAGGEALGFSTTPPLLAHVDATPYTLGYFLHDSSYSSMLASPIASIINQASNRHPPQI